MATINDPLMGRLYDIEQRGEWNDADRAYISHVIRVLLPELVHLAETVQAHEAAIAAGGVGYDLGWYANHAIERANETMKVVNDGKT